MSALSTEEWAAACRLSDDGMKQLRKRYTAARRALEADEKDPSPWADRKEERSRKDRDALATKIRARLSEAAR